MSKFKFFILKLWEFARLFAAMACVNLVFPPQKLNSNDTLQRDTRGFNAAFSHWIPSVSVVQFTVQMSKLNGLGKTHRERIFVVELSTNEISLLFIQIHSETDIFLSTKVIWETEKRAFISYLSAWGSDRRVCLKILPSRKNEIYLWKMGTKVGMYSATHESVTLARGQR